MTEITNETRRSEQSTLGGALVNRELAELCSSFVEIIGAPFYSLPEHQIICGAVVEIYDAGAEINPVTVAAHLNRRGELEAIGGAGYLVELTGEYDRNQAHLKAHIERLMTQGNRGSDHKARRGPKGDLKAIETRYAGCRFRSRLEARWCVFFNALGIEWAYEPQGFDLPSGRYLPDFWLPGVQDGIWYEVKGQKPTEKEEFLGRELAAMTGSTVVISAGDIPWPTGDYVWPEMGRSICLPEGGWDEAHEWCIGPISGQVGIEFNGIGSRIDVEYRGGDVYNWNHPRLVEAYRAARSARFEHGETPAAPGGAA